MAVTVREAAGSLLVVGLAGTELTGLERAWLKLVRPEALAKFGDRRAPASFRPAAE